MFFQVNPLIAIPQNDETHSNNSVHSPLLSAGGGGIEPRTKFSKGGAWQVLNF